MPGKTMVIRSHAHHTVQVSPPLNYRLPLTQDPGFAALLKVIDDADNATSKGNPNAQHR